MVVARCTVIVVRAAIDQLLLKHGSRVLSWRLLTLWRRVIVLELLARGRAVSGDAREALVPAPISR